MNSSKAPRFLSYFVIAPILFAACSSDSSSDNSTDAALDSESDIDAADSDTGDATPDSEQDVDADSGEDADSGSDAEPDTEPDADVAELSPDVDATTDTDPSCEPGAYLGDEAWTAQLVVEQGAALCSYPAREWFSEGEETQDEALARYITAEFAKKSVATPVPGTYALPVENAAVPFSIPMCISSTTADAVALEPAEAVNVESVEFAIGMTDGVYVTSTHDLDGSVVNSRIVRPLGSNVATLAATPAESHEYGMAMVVDDERLYVSCNLKPRDCVDLELPERGTISLDQYLWASSPGLGFAAPTRVRGVYNGTSFDVTDYHSMISIYGHHAFTRYYYIAFPEPISDACGLRISYDFAYAYAPADCNGMPLSDFISITETPRECE